MSKKTEFYKAWVNQPSKFQPYHEHHGRYGTVLDEDAHKARIIFDGEKYEHLFIERNALNKV